MMSSCTSLSILCPLEVWVSPTVQWLVYCCDLCSQAGSPVLQRLGQRHFVLGEALWTRSAPFCWVLPTMVVTIAGPLLSSLTVVVFSLWLHCLPNESILPSEVTPSIKTVKSLWPDLLQLSPGFRSFCPLSLHCACRHSGHFSSLLCAV